MIHCVTVIRQVALLFSAAAAAGPFIGLSPSLQMSFGFQDAESCVFWVLLQTNYWPPRFSCARILTGFSEDAWYNFEREQHHSNDWQGLMFVSPIVLGFVAQIVPGWKRTDRLNAWQILFPVFSGCGSSCLDCRSLASSFLPWQRGWDIEAAIDTTSKPLQHQTLVHVFVTICWIAFSFSELNCSTELKATGLYRTIPGAFGSASSEW